ncbi:polyubiquitin 12-like [Megalobrama amblycephala]|uniref:polyubiquitin 12-like n=1 Tax=Megalobrama amblycephala TaxID=75352 RepID=UPI002014362A|nr:polyubiquitin 12-like [Megalobrama amblycephala]
MAMLQVYMRINKDTIKTVSLSTSDEDIGKPTVKDLKKKALSLFPGVNGSEHLRLIFNGKDLEDDKKLEYYGIKELSVIQAIMKMRGGKDTVPLDEEFPRIHSMA